MKLSFLNGIYRICTVVITCLLLVLSVASCEQNDEIQIEGDSDFSSDTSSSVSDCYYNGENAVFLKLEILKIYDEDFYVESSGGRDFILMDCRVILDLYESGVNSCETILIPVRFISTTSTMTTETVKSWLSDFDYIYVYSNIQHEDRYISYPYREMDLESNIAPCYISGYEILPASDGRVRIELLDAFISENRMGSSYISDMERFCYENISCETFEDNVRKLSKDF